MSAPYCTYPSYTVERGDSKHELRAKVPNHPRSSQLLQHTPASLANPHHSWSVLSLRSFTDCGPGISGREILRAV